ncbi:hypothetical protein ACHAWO_010127 [Cyclotella atomus]|uniref:Uncharacterized protein n=1 Tax=Cyclotella atomus TaxID=382360 RepID=A0ABD3NCF0_9STRA
MLTNNDKTAPVRAAKFVFLKKCGVRVMTHSRFDVDILHFWRCAYKQLGITSDLSGCASLESLESDVMREFGLRGINKEKVTVEVVQGNVLKRMEPIYFGDLAYDEPADPVDLTSTEPTTAPSDESADSTSNDTVAVVLTFNDGITLDFDDSITLGSKDSYTLTDDELVASDDGITLGSKDSYTSVSENSYASALDENTDNEDSGSAES